MKVIMVYALKSFFFVDLELNIELALYVELVIRVLRPTIIVMLGWKQMEIVIAVFCRGRCTPSSGCRDVSCLMSWHQFEVVLKTLQFDPYVGKLTYWFGGHNTTTLMSRHLPKTFKNLAVWSQCDPRLASELS